MAQTTEASQGSPLSRSPAHPRRNCRRISGLRSSQDRYSSQGGRYFHPGRSWGQKSLRVFFVRPRLGPNVVVSNPIGPYEPSYPTMWTNSWCRSSTWGSEFLSNGRQWPTSARYCPSPQPATTLGEARARDLAAQHGWHTVIAVTFRPHISRARLILQRCFHGDLIMAASPADIAPAQWVYEYVYQTTGFVKALFADQC